jgi:hypothetical protein
MMLVSSTSSPGKTVQHPANMRMDVMERLVSGNGTNECLHSHATEDRERNWLRHKTS